MWSNIFWTPKKVIRDRLKEYKESKKQSRLYEFSEKEVKDEE